MTIRSKRLLEEMKVFVWKNGRPEAQTGYNDDLVMSFGIGMYLRDTSYAATYWPWCQVLDPETGKNVWVPASALIPGVYAFNDRAADPWFAPAGINRGGLSTVLRAQYKLTQANKDDLYESNINPLASLLTAILSLVPSSYSTLYDVSPF